MIFMTQTKIILQHCMSGNLRKTHMRANNVLISAYQTVRFWVLCQLQKKSISVIGFIGWIRYANWDFLDIGNITER